MEDFKSAASAIPPPRHVVRNPNSSKPFPLSPNHQYRNVNTGAWKMRDYSFKFFARIASIALIKDSSNRQELTS